MNLKLFFLAVFLIGMSAPVFAGNPYYIDESGALYKWKDGKVEVWLDPGDLTDDITYEEAAQAVREACAVWMGAKLPGENINNLIPISGGLEFTGFNKLGSDITGDNYQGFFPPGFDVSNAERRLVILFDKPKYGNDNHKTIVEDLILKEAVDEGDKVKVLGITNINAVDQDKKQIVNATIILNGTAVAINPRILKAVLVHEIGHALNLDHSAVNDDCFEDKDCTGDLNGWEYLPTMYKLSITQHQESLHYDDIVWLGFIYNSGNLRNQFCYVKGDLLDYKSRGFQGGQITVSETGGGRRNIATAVSGGFYKACVQDDEASGRSAGRYIIPGIRPGAEYKVNYGPIPTWCTSNKPGECGTGSMINPFAPPRDLPAGEVLNESDELEFECENEGEIISARKTRVAADLDEDKYKHYKFGGEEFNCEPGKGKVPVDEDEGQFVTPYGVSASKKGWCSLAPSAVFSPYLFIFMAAVLAGLVARRYRV